MHARTIWLHGLCAGLLLVLGCRADALVLEPAVVPTPAAAATAPPTSTANVAQLTTVVTATQPEVKPTASPTPATLQVTVDDERVSTDSLPSPEAYYAELLAKHGKDLSPCAVRPVASPGTCPKPTSLGEIELKQQVNVELILDASGSMAEGVGRDTKIATAKRVLSDFIQTLPKNANVALRVYGHNGTSSTVPNPEQQPQGGRLGLTRRLPCPGTRVAALMPTNLAARPCSFGAAQAPRRRPCDRDCCLSAR